MGTSPVAILVIIGIYVAFFAVISSGISQAERTDNPNIEQDPHGTIQTDGFGGINIIADIIHAVIGVIVFIFNALTFNVTGAPAYIRAPVAIAITSSLIWSVVTLIRGN